MPADGVLGEGVRGEGVGDQGVGEDGPVAPHVSSPDLLSLHALRLKGSGAPERLAARFALDPAEVSELMLDFEAVGWVRRAAFDDVRAWALTDAGRAENERQLADELARVGGAEAVAQIHRAFLSLNARFATACTNWQIRALPGDPLAANDHTDVRWDDRVLDEFAVLGRRLEPLGTALAGVLARFDGYVDRYAGALTRVERGGRQWIDGVGRDSCHAVWFELHEDLIATLGLRRGDEPALP